jgi:hypothetical protein
VSSREELEQLSSEELHDRALGVARHRVDVRFLWRLLEALPAAEASAGRVEEAEDDVHSLLARLNDLRTAGEADVADALRPLYIDYLAEHG